MADELRLHGLLGRRRCHGRGSQQAASRIRGRSRSRSRARRRRHHNTASVTTASNRGDDHEEDDSELDEAMRKRLGPPGLSILRSRLSARIDSLCLLSDSRPCEATDRALTPFQVQSLICQHREQMLLIYQHEHMLRILHSLDRFIALMSSAGEGLAARH